VDILKMLGQIEAKMIEKVEFYDTVRADALSGTIKEKQRWDETLGKADADLKYRKYLEAKAREAEL